MKILLLAMGLLSVSASCVSQNPKDDKDLKNERLVYFSFDHHNSMAIFYGEKYEVNTTKDGRVHVLIDEGYPGEKEFYLNDSTIFDELQVIVDAYEMDKYKKNYQPEMPVTDGDSWDLYCKYDSNRRISSGGYMAWPSNYREARHAITEYFKKWRAYEQGVLAVDCFRFTCKDNKGCDIEYALERGKKEATLTLRNAEKGIDKTLKVSNDCMREVQEMCNTAMMKSELYNYHTDDPDATRCTYSISYNTGDTVSGYTCYTQYPGPKERAVFNFFSRWLEQAQTPAEE